MKKRVLFIVLLIFVVLCFSSFQKIQVPNEPYSMFSWNPDVILKEERENLLAVLEKKNITAVYQEVAENYFNTGELENYIEDLQNHNVNVYYLIGDSNWGLEKDGASMKEEINRVILWNKSHGKEKQLAGIIFDIEPYTLDTWKTASLAKKEKLMTQFIDGVTEGYKVAKSAKLPMIMCIPHFYERYSAKELERLIAKGCDGIAVMNYDRTDEYKQIENEVKLSKEYKKAVICIAELQKPGIHELKNINTYYNVGIGQLAKSWKRLDKKFSYDRLYFSYHYYEPLKEMLDVSYEDLP